MLTMDLALGFHQIAKNNYYPGWHQQVSVSELLMNKTSGTSSRSSTGGSSRSGSTTR